MYKSLVDVTYLCFIAFQNPIPYVICMQNLVVW
jgi:hypothetical protein